MTIEEMGAFVEILNGRVLLDIVDGTVIAASVLSDEYHVATLASLIELLQSAGFTVTKNQ